MGLSCRPSCRHVRASNSSSSDPGPPGRTTTASAFMIMTFLRSCMVSVITTMLVRSVLPTSRRTRCTGMTPNVSPSGGLRRARDLAHQARHLRHHKPDASLHLPAMSPNASRGLRHRRDLCHCVTRNTHRLISETSEWVLRACV